MKLNANGYQRECFFVLFFKFTEFSDLTVTSSLWAYCICIFLNLWEASVNMNFMPMASAPLSSFVLKDGLGCIPQRNPLKLGHTLDRANMWWGMHAALREVGVPPGLFTQTQ